MLQRPVCGFLEAEVNADTEAEHKAKRGFNPLARSESDRQAHYDASDAMREALLKNAMKLYDTAISAQIEAAASVISNGGSLGQAENEVKLTSSGLISAQKKLYESVFVEFAGETYNSITARKAFDDKIKRSWLDVVADFLRIFGGQKVTDLNGTTSEFIGRAMATATENQWGPIKAARELRKSWKEASVFRTERIARTEILGASNMGSIEGARSTGLDLKKKWVATLDDRIRSSHIAMNSEPAQDLDQPYSNDLMFPGDPSGKASEIINCRCTQVYEVIE